MGFHDVWVLLLVIIANQPNKKLQTVTLFVPKSPPVRYAVELGVMWIVGIEKYA
jgi:hypothetical protein